MDAKNICFQSLEEIEEERWFEFQQMSYEERWDNLQNLVLMNFTNFAEEIKHKEEAPRGIILQKKALDNK